MKGPNFCHIDWKTGGIVIGVLSLIGSFPVSVSGDVSVSLHFLIVSGCLLYGIYKERFEFLLPYLVELIIILIECLISIVNFILLPNDESSFEGDVVNDFFYEHPKSYKPEEKRFILGTLAVTSIVIIFFWAVVFTLYRRMRYATTFDKDSNSVEMDGKSCA